MLRRKPQQHVIERAKAIIGNSITEHAYVPSLCGKSVFNAGARRWRSAIEAAVCPSWSSAHAVSVIQIPQ
jgi:hypothetical protein